MSLTFLVVAALAAGEQINIALIERMPNVPQPFQIIDWQERARKFDQLAFDANATGKFLPLLKQIDDPVNITAPAFALPSYVGGEAHRGEAICALAAVLSGTLAGCDKSKWAPLCLEWFNATNGEHVVLNNPGARSGGSFWYDILPGVLFAQLADRHPNVAGLDAALRTSADRWREAVVALGGTNADFNFTAFRLATMQPQFNGRWREPDAAAGIGWLELMAWNKFRDTNHREAATWCADFLERRPAAAGSPLYECLAFYAPVLAARLNAEHGRNYDVAKLVNWCFSENRRPDVPRPGWGIIAARWGEYDCHGLQGSTTDDRGYAFAMNTFQAAAALAPLPRYDARYARAIGKWLLNVANNARLFYPDALPAEHQSCPGWLSDVVGYEGLRQKGLVCGKPIAEKSERAWEFHVPATMPTGTINFVAHTTAPPNTFTVSTAASADGPWRKLFSFPHNNNQPGETIHPGAHLPNLPAGRSVFFKVDSAETNAPLHLDSVYMNFVSPNTPFAMGDALRQPGRAKTDFAMYGAAHVGYLAALVRRTSAAHILQLDLLATDFFHAPAFPTFLYFNPDHEPQTVRINVGAEPRDLYDTVAHDFVRRNVTGESAFTIPADTARILVLLPANGKLTTASQHTLLNGVVIDFANDHASP